MPPLERQQDENERVYPGVLTHDTLNDAMDSLIRDMPDEPLDAWEFPRGFSVFDEGIPMTPPSTPTRRRVRNSPMPSRNKGSLESFTAYCKEHPQERFFQALRNWAKDAINPRINYILTAEVDINSSTGYKNLGDTFYLE